jgi:phospholipid/cholesterol/gamma-HCH transport system permease protein
VATTDNLVTAQATSLGSLIAEFLKRQIKAVQDFTALCGRAVASMLTGPRYIADTLEQADIIGVGSLPIVLLTGFFIGAVMVLQTAAQFVRFGETSLTGDVVSLALVRELGPTITGLLVAGS